MDSGNGLLMARHRNAAQTGREERAMRLRRKLAAGRRDRRELPIKTMLRSMIQPAPGTGQGAIRLHGRGSFLGPDRKLPEDPAACFATFSDGSHASTPRHACNMGVAKLFETTRFPCRAPPCLSQAGGSERMHRHQFAGMDVPRFCHVQSLANPIQHQRLLLRKLITFVILPEEQPAVLVHP